MDLFVDKPGDEGLPGAKRRLAMIAVMMATAMAVFDGAIVNIALPQMAYTLHVQPGTAVWISSSYLLAASMLLASFAGMAAHLGFRRLFVAGVSIFTLSSLGCALSTSLPMLVVMRVIQGIGGAATMSIGPAIMRSIFPSRLLGRAIGVNALLVGTSTAVAPILGGTLLSALGWPWLFAINIPLGLAAIALAARVMPNERTARHEPFDVLGAVLSAIALGALVMTANAFAHPVSGSHAVSTITTAIAYGVAAVVAGTAFVIRQRYAPRPLIPLTLFSSPRFSLAALTSLVSFISQGITFVALPFMFQTAYGYSALASALLFMPWPVGIIVAAPWAGKLSDRYPPALISTCGLLCFAVGLALLATLPAQASIVDIGLRSLVCGIGFGCFQSPNNREMMANVPRSSSSYASGVLAIMRISGQCLGAAAVGSVLSAYTSLHSTFSDNLYAIHLGLWGAFGATAMATVISVSRLRHIMTLAKEERL